MKKILNKFINWKNNIKLVHMYELNAVLSDLKTLEQIKNNISAIKNLLEDLPLKEFLTKNDFIHEPFELNSNFFGEKYWVESMPLIGESPYHRTIVYKSIMRQNRILNNTSFDCKVEQYPNKLIQFILSTFHSELLIMMSSNTLLNSWDTATHPINYKYRGGVNINIDPKSGFEKVDVSDRPGRPASLENFYFKGAHEYWFGAKAFKFFSKNHLLNFQNTIINEELDNEIIHVKLFEMEQYWENFAQERLASFRRHLNIDVLEKQYLQKISLLK